MILLLNINYKYNKEYKNNTYKTSSITIILLSILSKSVFFNIIIVRFKYKNTYIREYR